MEEVVAPVLHAYVPPPDAISSALSPAQIAEGVTVGLIFGVVVTKTEAVSVHPFAFVTVTVYLVVVVGVTTMEEVVEPSLHE